MPLKSSAKCDKIYALKKGNFVSSFEIESSLIEKSLIIIRPFTDKCFRRSLWFLAIIPAVP